MNKYVGPKDVHELLALDIYPKLPDKIRDNQSEAELADYILNLLVSTGDLKSKREATEFGISHGFRNYSLIEYSKDDSRGNESSDVTVVYPTKEAYEYTESLVTYRIDLLYRQLIYCLNKHLQAANNKVSIYPDRIEESNIMEVRLFTNPFFILGASVSDNRRKIAALCEEKSLYMDTKICEEARNILITPHRRLSAEMHWFPDSDPAEIQSLIAYINDPAKNDVPETDSIAHLCSLSQLNAYISAFEGKGITDYQVLKRDILRISRLFEGLNPEEIRMILNEKRTIAGFPQIETTNDIASVVVELRSEIRKAITQKLSSLNSTQYIDFVTTISESFSSRRNKGQAVLEDIIAEYELKISDQMEDKAKSVSQIADNIANNADRINVDSSLNDLLNALSAWDKLAQPIQLGALTKGDAHKESAEMFRKMRDLSITLHNKYGLSEQALSINSAMQTVFAEMPEHLVVLKEDEKKLKEQVLGKRTYDHLNQKIQEIDGLIRVAKKSIGFERRKKIDEVLREALALDSFIQNNLSEGERQKTREIVGFMVRNLAIELVNNEKDVDNGLYIISELVRRYPRNTFETFAAKLSEDQTTLLLLKAQNQRNVYNGNPGRKYDNTPADPPPTHIFRKWCSIIFVIATLVAIIYNSIPSSNSTPHSTSKPSSSYSSATSAPTTGTTIVFEKEGGNGGTSTVTAFSGQSMPSASAPKRSGYKFRGYYSSPDGKGTKYYDEDMKSAHNWGGSSSSSTLYAYWEQEKLFSQNLSVGDLVYIDVKSVVPSFSITTQYTTNGVPGLSYLSALVLECTPETGNTSKYVYISFSDYKRCIDSNASETNLQFFRSAETVHFSEVKRIHGTAKDADKLCDGLSKKVGTLVLQFSSIETISEIGTSGAKTTDSNAGSVNSDGKSTKNAQNAAGTGQSNQTSKNIDSYYVVGTSEKTFDGLYKKMCVNLDIQKHPIPTENSKKKTTYSSGEYEQVVTLRNDSGSSEEIGYIYTKYNQSTPQYIVRNWTGYHEHGEQIQMKVFYSPEGQYIGNIRIDKTNNKSNSSSRSPFSIPGEGMHNLK